MSIKPNKMEAKGKSSQPKVFFVQYDLDCIHFSPRSSNIELILGNVQVHWCCDEYCDNLWFHVVKVGRTGPTRAYYCWPRHSALKIFWAMCGLDVCIFLVATISTALGRMSVWICCDVCISIASMLQIVWRHCACPHCSLHHISALSSTFPQIIFS